MKTLVVYYSLTGNCKKIAEKIASETSADLEAVQLEDEKQIIDGKPAGPLVMGGWFGKLPKIKNFDKDPSAYDQVILGAPVWAFNLASPMKSYLKENSKRLPQKVSFFVCHGGIFGNRALKKMSKLAERKPAATLLLRDKELRSGAWDGKVMEFSGKIR